MVVRGLSKKGISVGLTVYGLCVEPVCPIAMEDLTGWVLGNVRSGLGQVQCGGTAVLILQGVEAKCLNRIGLECCLCARLR